MGDPKDGNLAAEIFGDQTVNTDQAPKPGEPGADGKEANKEGSEKGQEPERKLAGRFATPEELEKGYRELEKWETKNAQDNAALRRELEELRKTAAPDQSQKQQEQFRKYAQEVITKAVVDEDPEPLIHLIGQLADQVAERRIQGIYKEIAPIIGQAQYQGQINAFLKDNPEAVEYMDDMVKILDVEPALVEKPDWLDKAYKRALHQKIGPVQKAKADAAAKDQAEKEAAGMPGGAARRTPETETETDKIKKGIFGDPTKERGIFDD